MAEIEFKENEYDNNPLLKEEVKPENELKNLLVNYVGDQHNPKSDTVTVEMIVETLAKEFPEFILALAEENFFRGYNQALIDLGCPDESLTGGDIREEPE